jgi:hypothetical protein
VAGYANLDEAAKALSCAIHELWKLVRLKGAS